MNKFSMNPVPDRKTFIRTVRRVIYDDLYDKLENKNTEFYQTIESCVRLMYDDGFYEGHPAWLSKKKDWTLDDIMEIYTKVNSLSTFGAGLHILQRDEVDFLRDYIRQYIFSQKITTSKKAIPHAYEEEVEADFIRNTIDFLGQLYNNTDKRTQFSKSLEKCVELFWIYDVTWKRVQTSITREDIDGLLKKLGNIGKQDANSNLKQLMRYITDWFRFNNKPASTPDITTRVQELEEEVPPDITTRVQQLEEEVQELRRQVQELSFHHPAPLQRHALLKQLARCT